MTVENLKYKFTQEEIVDGIHLGKQGLIHMDFLLYQHNLLL